MVRIAFRLDDPSPTSDHDLERHLIDVLVEYGLPATFATIPLRETSAGIVGFDASSAAHLREGIDRGVVEIALHGYLHKHRGQGARGEPTEFAGRPREAQTADIQAGLEALGEVFPGSIRGFVPPWNSYDRDTLEALAGLGFEYVSAAWPTPSGASKTPCLLPATTRLPQARKAVQEARRFSALDPLVVVLFHHYDFAEHGEQEAVVDLPWLRDLLAWVSAQPDLRPISLADAARATAPSGALWAVRQRGWAEGLHWRLQLGFPRHCLVASPAWRVLPAVIRNGVRTRVARAQ